jgi:hypothetical protein
MNDKNTALLAFIAGVGEVLILITQLLVHAPLLPFAGILILAVILNITVIHRASLTTNEEEV